MDNENKIIGLPGTISWFLILALLLALIQAFVVWYVATPILESRAPLPAEEIETILSQLAYNGMVVTYITILSSIVCLTLLFLAIKLNKGLNIKDYLGFSKTVPIRYIQWCGIFLAALIILKFCHFIFGYDSIPKVMIDIYLSASPIWLLWIAVVIIAPIYEEILFRGFLFKNISNTALGSLGAIIVTSCIWAATHFQYDFYYLFSIFILGLIYGYSMHKTKSIYVPISLHMLNNLIATIQTHLLSN